VLLKPFISVGDVNELVGDTKATNAGSRAFLIYLAGYNGKANDSSVTVGFARAFGIYNDIGCDGQSRQRATNKTVSLEYDPLVNPGPDPRVDQQLPGPDGGVRNLAYGYAPSWDGCDRWLLHGSDFVGLTRAGAAPIRIYKGYVSNNQVVVVDEGPFVLNGREFATEQRTVVIKLAPTTDDAGSQRFGIENIVVSGRLRFEDAIKVLGSFSVSGISLCSLPATFEPRLVETCKNLDLAFDPALDHTGASCNAISFSVSADGTPATIEEPSIIKRFLSPAPPPDCANLPVLDEACNIVDAGGP
jgi:hypothetical protein